MKLKNGVSLNGVSARIHEALTIAARLHEEITGKEQTVTSGAEGYRGDGVHSKNSQHYDGRAADLRVWDILEWYAERLRRNLSPHITVILERNPPHIHIQEKRASR